jgi:hypothetical protein
LPNLDDEIAISFIRRLSSTENYPFHPEGEVHLAEVLQKHCDGPTHARYVIDEFDEVTTCPSVAMLRDAANRLGEVCQCGKKKWQHRDKGACARFAGQPAEDDGLMKTATGYAKFRESVPVVSGVPWEVCLQAETTCINLGLRGSVGGRKVEHGRVIDFEAERQMRLQQDEQRFPELVRDLRAGQEPDYKLLESQMRALFPHMWKGGSGSLVRAGASDRLKQLDYFASTK